MFASNLFRDEAELRQFCDDVQQDLRNGHASDAAGRVDFALGVLEEFGHPVAALCRAYPASAIQIQGWDNIAARLESLDKPDQPITAIGIDLSCHGDLYPDTDEAVAPYIETNFYSDGAFPFSTADRDTLCAGYTGSSAEWQGNFQDIDATISASGIGRLSFAIDDLERQHRNQASDDAVGSDAMVVAVAYRAVAVHQAVIAMIETHGLPRPLTVIVGSNESYPFFDAPVITSMEYLEHFAPADEAPATEYIELEVPEAIEPTMPNAPTYEIETPALSTEQIELEVPETIEPTMPNAPSYQIEAPTFEDHVSGTEIRRRFAEVPADVVETTNTPGFFHRVFSRRATGGIS